MKAITDKQPWASLIVEGIKDVENRTRPCPKKYIGQRVLIHAGAKSADFWSSPNAGIIDGFLRSISKGGTDWSDYPKGAIIGSVEIVDCVINHPSIWAEKTEFGTEYEPPYEASKPIYNWVLAKPIKFPKPIFAKGKLGFWESECEILICPKCGGYCLHDNHDAGIPNWGNPVHECEYCGYMILESEFEYLK